MMKYVQLGILAALVLVAVLLGLNLMNDRAAPAPEPAIAAATPVPSEPAPLDVTASAPLSASSSAASTPVQKPAVETKTSAPTNSTPDRRAPAAKPATQPRPSPSVISNSAHTAPATPVPAHEEVVRVDPPAATPDTRSLPAPPAPAPARTSVTERYDLMRPEASTPHPAHVPAPARTVTIPAGTILTIRTIQGLSSKTNSTGDSFTGTLDQPLVLEDMVIAERGSKVEGKVTEVTESGRVKGVAQIAITLTKINTSDGQTVDVSTQNFPVEAEKTTKSDATKVGIATGIGAALGAIFGGGKGAAIGAASGGAAGAGTVLVTKGKPAEIPSETRINFRLEKPLVLTEKINTK